MKNRFHMLIICLLFMIWILRSVPVQAGPLGLPPFQEASSTPEPTSTPLPSAPSPADIINAVNNLRIAHGLNALTVHSVLMEVAAEQASALAASEGTVGHERPCGMTLGQQLLVMGFPLWGDLSMDGYRSENWVAASNTEAAISAWLGDDEHTNTMLSANRSDIGAAAAVSDQIYVVLETALQTSTGQMQHTAFDILTGIPIAQTACGGYGDNSQYSIPVALNTARPDGDVIHEVKYGQTLWSIADQYHVNVEQVKRLNNLTEDTIGQGWKLLIQKGATQPAPPTPTFILNTPDKTQTPFPTVVLTTTPTSTPAPDDAVVLAESFAQNKLVIVALIISFSVLVAGVVGFGKKREN
jgi:uncharacterized protein YkwD